MSLLSIGKHKKAWYWLGISMGLCSAQASAASFENENLASDAAGVVNAVTAGIGSLSDALYNPAALAWQEGVQVMFTSQGRSRYVGVDTGSGSYGGNSSLGTRESFAFSWLPDGGQWGIAASVANPYDTRSNWQAAFPNLGFMNLEMTRYTLDGFWRVHNTLGVSLGLDIYDTSLRLDAGGKSFAGSDWSDMGAHAGLRWEFRPFWTLGILYRQGITAAASNQLGDTSKIVLPDDVRLGVAYALADDEMLVELDIKRTGWSSFKGFEVSNQGVVSQNHVAKLRDTTDIMLGLTWFWRHNTQLRFGYAYEQGANQADAYQPLVSDLSGHKIAIGFGGMMSTMHLDMTYTGYIKQKLSATGAYAGTYSDTGNQFMFSLSKKF